jgi:hypothetical protein
MEPVYSFETFVSANHNTYFTTQIITTEENNEISHGVP